MRRTGLTPSPLFLLLLAVTVAGGALAAADAGPVRTGDWAASLCLHEFGHALLAYWSGDRSVRAKGYLTLDIRRYTIRSSPCFAVTGALFGAIGGNLGAAGVGQTEFLFWH